MLQIYVRLLLAVIFSMTIFGCSDEPNRELESPQFGAAIEATENCEFQTRGTSSPPSSGTPTLISENTGTVISANFFDSSAIDPPYFDGNEFVSVCVSSLDANGNRTANITTDVGLDNDFLIKAYPQFIVGSKFGNISETSFRFYATNNLPEKDKWPVTSSNLSDQGKPFEFANLEYVSTGAGVGLPAFTNDLPSISITLDIDEQNIVGAERDIMLESWFYDTSTNAELIGNNVATGLPIANTLNNIVGVGHPHFDELGNVLLEMMVHIGALSPNDVSGATNNPGQNQLTEIFSGKDFDLDGIDDHFDVDSHIFLNSTNPADPKPGKYSSGVDANADGIDDADLLPVQFGTHLYSIWYGESFLSPIIIYSRETNSTLVNDFDPSIADMDLTTEGEIELPWNEFLDYTLTEVQPLLQALSVSWALDSTFKRISASGGAIGGVEFGVEPQTNNGSDQPYIIDINKFSVTVDGRHYGLTMPNDTQSPTLNIATPPTSNVTLPTNASFSGSASDTGGSGFNDVRLAIRNQDINQWYNFGNNSFSGAVGNGSTTANLTNTTITDTNWNYSVTLPAGEYSLFVAARDKAGNTSSFSIRRFSIAPDDTQSPTTTIDSPSASNVALPANASFSGSAADAGGSGFNDVRLAIRNQDINQWYNFSNNSFSGAIGNGSTAADLTNTTNTATDWNFNVALPSGEYSLFIIARDNSGNTSSFNVRRFSILSDDVQSPTTTIATPSADNITLPANATFTGSASDAGGSGFNDVRLAIRNQDINQWYNFGNNTFSGAVGNGSTPTNLTNTSITDTDWNLTATLPAGQYTLYIIARDNAGNTSGFTDRSFSVLADDIQSPITTIDTPSTQDATLPTNATFIGSGSDSGGSGFKNIRLAIRNPDISQWYNFSNNSFTGAVGNGSTLANLTNTTITNTDWNYSVTLPPGEYILFIIARDNAGNTSEFNVRSFTIE